MNQSKRLTDGALLIAVYVVLLLLSIFVPMGIIVSLFLLPIPFVIYASKHDWKYSIIVLLTAIILSSLFATIISLPLTVLVGLGGIMLGTAIHHRLHAYETWARGTLGFVFGLLFIYLFTQLVFQINWMDELDLILKESIQTSQDLMKQLGLGTPNEEEIVIMESVMGQAKILIPVWIALVSAILAFITQWISYKVISRLELKKLHFPPLRTLQFPVAIVWIYFIAMLFTFMDFDETGILFLGVQNIYVLVGLLISLQGFSFLFFYTNYRKWSIAFPIIILIITLILPFQLLYIIRIIGIIDIGFRLRERLSNEKK